MSKLILAFLAHFNKLLNIGANHNMDILDQQLAWNYVKRSRGNEEDGYTLMKALCIAIHESLDPYEKMVNDLKALLNHHIQAKQVSLSLYGLQNRDLQLDYMRNPTFTGFDQANLQLASDLYQTKILVYFMDGQTLCSHIYNRNYQKSIKIVKHGFTYDNIVRKKSSKRKQPEILPPLDSNEPLMEKKKLKPNPNSSYMKFPKKFQVEPQNDLKPTSRKANDDKPLSSEKEIIEEEQIYHSPEDPGYYDMFQWKQLPKVDLQSKPEPIKVQEAEQKKQKSVKDFFKYFKKTKQEKPSPQQDQVEQVSQQQPYQQNESQIQEVIEPEVFVEPFVKPDIPSKAKSANILEEVFQTPSDIPSQRQQTPLSSLHSNLNKKVKQAAPKNQASVIVIPSQESSVAEKSSIKKMFSLKEKSQKSERKLRTISKGLDDDSCLFPLDLEELRKEIDLPVKPKSVMKPKVEQNVDVETLDDVENFINQLQKSGFDLK